LYVFRDHVRGTQLIRRNRNRNFIKTRPHNKKSMVDEHGILECIQYPTLLSYHFAYYPKLHVVFVAFKQTPFSMDLTIFTSNFIT